jgi:distribution and morphology protein 31
MQQNAVPSQVGARTRSINTKPLTATFVTSRATTVTGPFLTLQFARTYVTSNSSEQPSKDGKKNAKLPEDLKSHPPEDQAVGGVEHEFPHARDLENYSRFFQRLAMSLPHPHRPTRDDFLNAATGFWQRLRVRFKWFTVRGFRKFNADDISAFITWFLFSQTLWILVGTCV